DKTGAMLSGKAKRFHGDTMIAHCRDTAKNVLDLSSGLYPELAKVAGGVQAMAVHFDADELNKLNELASYALLQLANGDEHKPRDIETQRDELASLFA
ncbi:hypothetical protein, partial [Pararhizobium sp.]|uniref:hypothetical protein n=1 Tax=Pararhizobium sp. TaxID=1977563 RepID=UPI003D0AC464